jgi:hypothetical protein
LNEFGIPPNFLVTINFPSASRGLAVCQIGERQYKSAQSSAISYKFRYCSSADISTFSAPIGRKTRRSYYASARFDLPPGSER